MISWIVGFLMRWVLGPLALAFTLYTYFFWVLNSVSLRVRCENKTCSFVGTVNYVKAKGCSEVKPDGKTN